MTNPWENCRKDNMEPGPFRSHFHQPSPHLKLERGRKLGPQRDQSACVRLGTKPCASLGPVERRAMEHTSRPSGEGGAHIIRRRGAGRLHCLNEGARRATLSGQPWTMPLWIRNMTRSTPPSSLWTTARFYKPLQTLLTRWGTRSSSNSDHVKPLSNNGKATSKSKKAKIGRRPRAQVPTAATRPKVSKPAMLRSICGRTTNPRWGGVRRSQWGHRPVGDGRNKS